MFQIYFLDSEIKNGEGIFLLTSQLTILFHPRSKRIAIPFVNERLDWYTNNTCNHRICFFGVSRALIGLRYPQ